MTRTKRHLIRRIALGFAIAAVVPAIAHARPVDMNGTDLRSLHAEALASSQYKLGPGEIPSVRATSVGPVEGLWWQLSLTMRSEEEPSAVSLLRISRDRDGGLNVNGRAWQEDGTLSARYWSEAAKERRDPASIFYFWKGERPRHANAPQLEGTGEIRVETADRATGYWTTRSDRDPGLNARTAGVYLRADPSDLQVLDGGSAEERAQLIA